MRVLVRRTEGMSPYIAAIVLIVVALALWTAWRDLGKTVGNTMQSNGQYLSDNVNVN